MEEKLENSEILNTDSIGSADRLAPLYNIYSDYLALYNQRVINNGALYGLKKFLMGSPPAADRKADNAFYKSVEEAINELEGSLVPGDEPLAAEGVRFVILEAAGSDDSSRLMIEAAQALAIPLIAHITAEDSTEILNKYKEKYPRRRMLTPRQRELVAALESAAK